MCRPPACASAAWRSAHNTIDLVGANRSTSLRSSTTLPGRRNRIKNVRPATRQQSAPAQSTWVTGPFVQGDSLHYEKRSQKDLYETTNSSFDQSITMETDSHYKASVSSGGSLLPSSTKVTFQSDILRPSTSMSVVTFDDGSYTQTKGSYRNVSISCNYRAPSLNFPAYLQSDRYNRTKKLREEQEAEGLLMPWRARKL